MNFGQALEVLKRGKKVRRKGWNGKGIFIKLYQPHVDLEKVAEAVHNAWWKECKKQGRTNHPDMIPYAELAENIKEYDRKTGQATIESMTYMTQPFLYVDSMGVKTDNPFADRLRVPWMTGQTDMLAEDWEVVEE